MVPQPCHKAISGRDVGVVTTRKKRKGLGGKVHGSHTAKAAAPGYLIGPSSILGTAVLPGVGEIWDLNGNLGQNYLFTRDGLWVQSLFKDVRGHVVDMTTDLCRQFGSAGKAQ